MVILHLEHRDPVKPPPRMAANTASYSNPEPSCAKWLHNASIMALAAVNSSRNQARITSLAITSSIISTGTTGGVAWWSFGNTGPAAISCTKLLPAEISVTVSVYIGLTESKCIERERERERRRVGESKGLHRACKVRLLRVDLWCFYI